MVESAGCSQWRSGAFLSMHLCSTRSYMTIHSSRPAAPPHTSTKSGPMTPRMSFTALLVIASIAGFGFFAAILFWPAGRLDWVAGWIYLALLTVSLFINFVYLRHVNPEVIEHRLRLGKGTIHHPVSRAQFLYNQAVS